MLLRLALSVLFVVSVSATAYAQTPEQELKKRSTALREKVTEMTELDFKRDVGVGVYTKDDMRKFLVDELKLGMSERTARKFELIGWRFGFWKKDFKIIEAYVALLTDSVAGFYHPRTKELKLVRDAGGDNPNEKLMEQVLGVKMADVYLLHELFHAAQDQHFNLMEYKGHNYKNDDLTLAIEALIEGEATLVHSRYMLGARYEALKRQFMAIPADPPKAETPRVLFNTLYFPYSLGYKFIDEVVKKREWKVASKMFQDPPLSTEQVLHPEKYLAAERDYPQDLSMNFSRLNKAMGAGWRRLDDNVQGEFTIRLIFEEFGFRRQGVAAASGWDGDRYAVYHRPKDDAVMSIWASTWDSEDEAKEFAGAYLELLQKKYEGFAEEGKRGGATVYTTKSDGKVLLERRGADVLFIEGAPDDDALKIVDPVWETLKKIELKKFERKRLIYC
ncbi:MAG TPA: hypothetical protein VI643_04015 [Planctomycetota bacterium]|nr:hypothetical protein [Planctomycetota bacterium]